MGGRVVFVRAALFVFACIWVFQVVRRLPDDVAEMRAPGEGAKKAAIAVIWLLTLVLFAWIAVSLPWVVSRLAGFTQLVG